MCATLCHVKTLFYKWKEWFKLIAFTQFCDFSNDKRPSKSVLRNSPHILCKFPKANLLVRIKNVGQSRVPDQGKHHGAGTQKPDDWDKNLSVHRHQPDKMSTWGSAPVCDILEWWNTSDLSMGYCVWARTTVQNCIAAQRVQRHQWLTFAAFIKALYSQIWEDQLTHIHNLF